MKFLACLILIFLVNTITSEKYACPEYDANFHLNDVVQVHTDGWRECGAVCSLVNDCEFWTFDTYSSNSYYDRLCYLKSSDGGLEKSEGVISGAKGCY